MFKRCLIVVLIVVSSCCAWGQAFKENPNIDYLNQTWTSWSGSTVISLWGKVYVVKPGEKADLKVRVVNKYGETSDINVNITDAAKPKKKQWRFVSSKEEADFSIKFVDKDEHFTVRFISRDEWDDWWHFSGLPILYGDE